MMQPNQPSGDNIAERLTDARDQFLGYIRKRARDPDLAEDILQDSLLRAIRAAPELRDEERLIPWFYRVLQNAIVDTYRRRGGGGRGRGASTTPRCVVCGVCAG